MVPLTPKIEKSRDVREERQVVPDLVPGLGITGLKPKTIRSKGVVKRRDLPSFGNLPPADCEEPLSRVTPDSREASA